MAMLFSLFRPLIDFALPPRCAGCGQIVADDLQLCTPCWTSIDFLSGSGCERCGTPLPSTALVCAPCLATPPAHDGVRAAVSYGEIARKVVLNLKHGRRVGLAALAARALERHLPSEPCVLVPVPLHRWRIWGRGFNQSALIAKHLAVNSTHDLALDHLRRIKATPMLRNLGANGRRLAMRGVFDINPLDQRNNSKCLRAGVKARRGHPRLRPLLGTRLDRRLTLVGLQHISTITEMHMARVEIYTKFLCPYCARAKALLSAKGAQFEEIDVTMDAALRRVMIDRASGGSTVPQIFINGQHIGGSDELAALDVRGGLDPLLAAA
jgi:GrxC family glutaredoxin